MKNNKLYIIVALTALLLNGCVEPTVANVVTDTVVDSATTNITDPATRTATKVVATSAIKNYIK